jgi:Domain of unknown function DUF29
MSDRTIIRSTIPQYADVPGVNNLYETDFHAWTQEQVRRLTIGDWAAVDVDHLIEEIDSLGKQQRQELRNRLSILLGHLLKWQFQPNHRSRSWLATLRIQRRDIDRLLQDNPSLKPYVEQVLRDAYENARDLAMAETNLPGSQFPIECPYPMETALDAQFYPGDDSELTPD